MASWFEGESWGPWIALGVVVVVFLMVCGWVTHHYRRFRRRRIAKRALGAERAAVAVLRRHGYVVLDTQVRRVWPVRHGVVDLDIELRADALVGRGRRRFIAEVKSSSLVADLRHGPTRRQLLEYAIAYGTDGVLLIDMHAQKVEEISFPGMATSVEKNLWSGLAMMLAIFVAGVCVGRDMTAIPCPRSVMARVHPNSGSKSLVTLTKCVRTYSCSGAPPGAPNRGPSAVTLGALWDEPQLAKRDDTD